MAPEPRRHLPVPLRVELRIRGRAWRPEYAVNLSPGGLCLHLREPVAVGDPVGVAFELPWSGQRLEVWARVVWVGPEEHPSGARAFREMGVAFDALDESVRAELRRYALQAA